MSIRQDRLTFFGVLAAVVIAVLGYLKVGGLYPVAGHADTPSASEQASEQQITPSDAAETQDKPSPAREQEEGAHP